MKIDDRIDKIKARMVKEEITQIELSKIMNTSRGNISTPLSKKFHHSRLDEIEKALAQAIKDKKANG